MIKPAPLEPHIKIEPETFLRPQFPAFHQLDTTWFLETNQTPQQKYQTQTNYHQPSFKIQSFQSSFNNNLYQQETYSNDTKAPYLVLPDRYNNDSNLYNSKKKSNSDNILEGLWTDEEHEAFLTGLKEIGRKWTRISREFVKTRDPNQVISHAQKYELRLRTEGKEQM